MPHCFGICAEKQIQFQKHSIADINGNLHVNGIPSADEDLPVYARHAGITVHRNYEPIPINWELGDDLLGESGVYLMEPCLLRSVACVLIQLCVPYVNASILQDMRLGQWAEHLSCHLPSPKVDIYQ
jgi:hypothetical protein